MANNSSENEDWSNTLADKLTESVGEVRKRMISPLKGIAKLLAYIPIIFLIGAGVVTLLTIGIFRLVDNYQSIADWLTFFIIGTVFAIIGLMLWFKRPRFPK